MQVGDQSPGQPPAGFVAAVSLDGKHRFGKKPQLSLSLLAGLGVAGDAHAGRLIKHRYLARRDPRLPNLRQVHLFPSETLGALSAAGYDVGPGDLGENITTTGLDLEILPLDTELRMGASACIRLTGLRTPCVLIDRYRSGLRSRLVSRKPGPPFRAGVMAITIASGTVAAGDPIWAVLPSSSRCPLLPL